MNNGKSQWLMWLAGTVMTLLTIGITTIGTNVIANDRESRKRDTMQTEKIHKIEVQTHDKLEKIMVQLSKIQTQLEYINGRHNP